MMEMRRRTAIAKCMFVVLKWVNGLKKNYHLRIPSPRILMGSTGKREKVRCRQHHAIIINWTVGYSTALVPIHRIQFSVCTIFLLGLLMASDGGLLYRTLCIYRCSAT